MLIIEEVTLNIIEHGFDDKSNSMGLHIIMQLAKNVAYTNSFDH